MIHRVNAENNTFQTNFQSFLHRCE